eukprot:COSAG05_NODE_445_length_9773_cov_4.588071_6_plen_332_part_00
MRGACLAALIWAASATNDITCVQQHQGAVLCDGQLYQLQQHDERLPALRVLQEAPDVGPGGGSETSGKKGGAAPCEGSTTEEGHPVVASGEWWLFVAISTALVLSAGLFSGLTIGLMSLDLEELRMIVKAPFNPHHPHNHEYAAEIIPLVEDQHLLLVTLLLSNAAAMEALPIFLDKVCPSPLIAILMSVTLVLFFGEVIPQALCTAYGLAIGAKTAPAVRVLIKLLYLVAKPIAMLLDHIFGHEIKTLRRVDWIARLDLIAESAQDAHMKQLHEAETGEKPLTRDEVSFMKGVLGLFDTKVGVCINPTTPPLLLAAPGTVRVVNLERSCR